MPSDNPERENRILDAASELITHYGYDKTTVSDIARQAGVSKGAIYLHFDSKERLFDTLIMRETLSITEELLDRVDNDPNGGTILSLYKHSLMIIGEHPLLRALTTSDKRILGDYYRRNSSRMLAQNQQTYGVELIQMFQEANLIRSDLNPKIVSYILGTFRFGLLTTENILPGYDTPPLMEIAPVLAETLERGLAPIDGEPDKEAGKRIIHQMAERVREILKTMQER